MDQNLAKWPMIGLKCINFWQIRLLAETEIILFQSFTIEEHEVIVSTIMSRNIPRRFPTHLQKG